MVITNELLEHTETWISPSNGNMTYAQIIERIKEYTNPINSKNEEINKFIVIASTDSQKHGKLTKFTTAITVRRMISDNHGCGGIYFYRNDYLPSFNTDAIKQKILTETTMVISIAHMIDHDLEDWCIWLMDNSKQVEIELHIDVSETGESRVALKDVKKMVLGTNYKYKIKPESYGASKVSDKYSK